MTKRDWERRQTQVVLRDLEAWVQQLYEDHRVRCELWVSLPTPADGIKHGVTLVAFKVKPLGQREEMHRDWDVVADTTTGAIEAAGIKMISKLLLDLENDAERAQREGQTPLWR